MPKESSFSTIYRSETNSVVGGVCGGLGEYSNIDPNIIRLIFVLITVFGGSGIVIYIILWIILPKRSQTSSGRENRRENLKEMREKIHEFAHDIRNSVKGKGTVRPHNRHFIAYTAILLGVLFLLDNFGFNNYFNFTRLWPLLLILLGVSIILRK